MCTIFGCLGIQTCLVHDSIFIKSLPALKDLSTFIEPETSKKVTVCLSLHRYD